MSDQEQEATRRREGVNIGGRLFGEKPEFPPVHGADRIDDAEKGRISDAAWANANGNPHAYQQLIAEHLNGEIDLFSDAPTAIGGGRALPRMADRRISAPVQGGSSEGVGSDRLTATGGETHGLDGPAQALSGVSSVAGVPAEPEPQPSIARVGRSGSEPAPVGVTGAPIGETGSGAPAGEGALTGEETR